MRWLLVSAVLIQPLHSAPISRAMVREQLCNIASHARTTQEATEHSLRCYLRYR